LNAQDVDLGRSEPPYIEATATMPSKLLRDAEKRCDMVRELSEKSEANYRVLSMKVMEQWQASIKKDKTFLKELLRHKTVAFTVKTDGTIEIHGVDEADVPAKLAPARSKRRSARSTANQ
jgi:hypothetical protein